MRRRPTILEVGASLLAVVGVLSVGRVAYGVVVNLGQDQWSSGARAVFLFLNSIVLIFALFLLVLAHQVRRGRQWAWIVSMIMLPFTTLVGGLMLLLTALSGAIPFAGIAVVATSLAALLVLTLPRAVRDFFLRNPPPAPPQHQPWAAAQGQPWGPGR
ncbi:hypothetical protein [Paractinoplanes maris]|uniref:hypothetical protein n=1 Tax=Paractinoplanes maris TaxID=1734446 RepID=UPI0020217850|nr:hypothetical protein [Actinoplanes maris]